jgi:hypothetical protein
VAVGENTAAAGEDTVAVGEETVAVGEETVAVGEDTVAVGGDTVVGEETVAVGEVTVAVGEVTVAVGEVSVVLVGTVTACVVTDVDKVTVGSPNARSSLPASTLATKKPATARQTSPIKAKRFIKRSRSPLVPPQ